MTLKHYVYQALSESGEPSSKRLLGAAIILSYLIVTTIMAFRFGATEIIKDLLQTGFIGGCSLLGISSVTNIFKNNEQDN